MENETIFVKKGLFECLVNPHRKWNLAHELPLGFNFCPYCGNHGWHDWEKELPKLVAIRNYFWNHPNQSLEESRNYINSLYL